MMKLMIFTLLLVPNYLFAKEYNIEIFFTTNNISMDLPNNNNISMYLLQQFGKTLMVIMEI
tara:strand:+ start:168 stop:350 length:183 start_codon:yes stop_codon:yes gene_type:complete